MRIPIHEYYITIAKVASLRAGCPKRKVGAVITDSKNRVLSIGYNSPPRKLPPCFDHYCGASDTFPCIAAHAEISAITSCKSLDSAYNIYITCSPCPDCTKVILTTNIQNIYFEEEHKTWQISKQLWNGNWEQIKCQKIY